MRHIVTTLFIALTLLGLSACNKISIDNYQRLKAGQSFEEVVAIIGQPSKCDETLGVRQCQWGDDKSGISGNFVGGQALIFSARNLK